MNYCETCKSVYEESTCPVCGKTLREVQADDFCLLAEVGELQGNFYQDTFAEQDIPCVVMPWRTGLEGRLALPAGKCRIFVPFSHFDTALFLLQEEADERKNGMIKRLYENFDKLHIQNPRLEKKLRKKLKISPEEDFFTALQTRIRSCDKIVDGGVISFCPKRGHYLFVYCKKVVITINSATYEIM